MSHQENLHLLDERTPKAKMSSAKKVLIVLAALGAVALIISGFLVYTVSTSDYKRQISGPVTITSEWLEVKLTPPLQPSHREQNVEIEFAQGYLVNNATQEIRFLDGSKVVPEVEIVDEDGGTYRLRIWALDERVIVFYYSNEGSYTNSQLPHDRMFPILRMRSNKPIECSKILWHCYTGK